MKKTGAERSRDFNVRNGEQLPPDTEKIMAAYKEPLKVVKNGHGYYGTIAYDKSKQYTQCHVCGYFFGNLGQHVRQHDKTVRQYKIEFGLPIGLSLLAPEKKHHMRDIWSTMTEEEKEAKIESLNHNKDNNGKVHHQRVRKSLYKKNLEGRCPDQLLDKILTLIDKLGHTPSSPDFCKEYGNGMFGSVTLTFGSWKEAINILNLAPTPDPSIRGGRFRYDQATLLKLLRDFKKDNNREPYVSDCVRGILPSHHTFKKYFGSWSKAKEFIR